MSIFSAVETLVSSCLFRWETYNMWVSLLAQDIYITLNLRIPKALAIVLVSKSGILHWKNMQD